jgi:hypothetical protein
LGFWASWLVLAVLALGTNLNANPLQNPKRLIGGRTVDLEPLFHWWTNHHGARPLKAWGHLNGTVIGTNSVGWIIKTEGDELPPRSSNGSAKATSAEAEGKFILRNPPLADLVEFEKLSGELKALNQQRGQIAGEEAQAKNRADVLAREQNAYRRSGTRSRTVAAESRQVKAVEDEAKRELKPLDQQIQDLKKRLSAYPNNDHYVLDCFALETSQELNGVRVYDYGLAWK